MKEKVEEVEEEDLSATHLTCTKGYKAVANIYNGESLITCKTGLSANCVTVFIQGATPATTVPSLRVTWLDCLDLTVRRAILNTTSATCKGETARDALIRSGWIARDALIRCRLCELVGTFCK